MTLRFRDSFAHYATANLASKWSNAGWQTTIQTTGGRWGGQCLLVPAGGAFSSLGPSVVLPPAATWYLGVALLLTGYESQQYCQLLQVFDASSPQLAITTDPNGLLQVRRGSEVGTVLWTDSVPFGLSAWHYLEFGFTVGATGSFEVRVDGVTRSGVQSANTQATTNASASQFRLGAHMGVSQYCNDLYILDNAGTVNNTFLGDVRVQALMPSADGDLSQLTPSSGTTHCNLVNEIPPDGDTSYVSSPTPGNVDLYQLADLAAVSGSVFDIAVYSFARKDDAGTRTVSDVIKTGGVEYDGAAQALGTSYTYLTEHWELNPATGVAWTIADVNALQAGVKVG